MAMASTTTMHKPVAAKSAIRPHSAMSAFIGAAAAVCCAVLVVGSATAATLMTDSAESAEGYFQLSWEADQPVVLLESTSPDFDSPRAIYTGSDSARVISGKPDGTWYYRLQTTDDGGVLSETVAVTVRHHSLARAFAFFALGAVVFVATLGLILFARPEFDERPR